MGIPLRVFIPEFENIRLLNIDAVANVCAAPPKFTVPVPAIKFVPVPFQAVALVAFTLSLLEPPFNIPFDKVTIPDKVCTNPEPRFKVPPVPLIVNALPLTGPVKVAVPAVFTIDIIPVVEKAPMF